MEQTTWWQILMAVFGGLGGMEFIKWISTRKSNKRIVAAQADGAELKNLEETTDFLQRQLQNKEERFVEQTDRLRRAQDDLFSEREKRHEAEMQLALKRCDDDSCPFRLPPNAYTPPRKGESRDEFHEARNQKRNEG